MSNGFRGQGFGLFIHWSVDSQLGVGISHTLVGASDNYLDCFFKDLPETFDPTHFDPSQWASLAGRRDAIRRVHGDAWYAVSA